LVPSGNQILGNYLGCDVTGTQALSTGPAVTTADGIYVQGANNTLAGNLISGNAGFGVALAHNPGNGGPTNFYQDFGGGFSQGNFVQGNLIGLDASGTKPLANEGGGVLLSDGAFDNLIGGTGPGVGNIIAFNGGPGVQVGIGGADAATTGNRIQGNSIHDNASLGIDLAGDGVSANGSETGPGPNNWQKFPVLTSAAAGSNVQIGGTVTGAPNTAFTVGFYADPSPDPSGHGQGQK
jgi:titin